MTNIMTYMNKAFKHILKTLCNHSVYFCIFGVFFSGVLHHSGRSDFLLQERQTSLQETCSHAEDMNLGLSLHNFILSIHSFLVGG